MSELKLVALDEEDLAIVSAHAQDAVLKAGEAAYQPQQRRFLLPINRFVWEKKTRFLQRQHERRRAVLHFDRVNAVRRTGFENGATGGVLELLAIRYQASEPPAGTIDLIFAGQATIRLDVECIEVRLVDLGAAWDTASRPRHTVQDTE